MYFDLQGLLDKTVLNIENHMKTYPALSLVVLDFPSAPQCLTELALTTITSNQEECFKEPVMSHAALELLLLNKQEICMAEVTAFNLIHLWAAVKDNQQLAKELVAQHVNLMQIRPTDLEGYVAASGLVTEKQLLDTLKAQAVLAQKQVGFPFQQQPIWKNSRSSCLSYTSEVWTHEHEPWTNDFLGCQPMFTGEHQWSVVLKTLLDDEDIIFGVIGSEKAGEVLSQTKYIWKDVGGWSYRGDGIATINGDAFSMEHPFFTQGDTVTFTLDLNPGGEENGSLSIAVNGGPAFKGITNLCDHIGPGGFLPAASLLGFGDCVEVTEIKEVWA
ncbi:expressed unknown protein [Seminavis robusta]|uniref:Uncharacterized protein n=1 Tax=Seminavis robusta TaxID=568900 RepID=A0A9N8DYX6_9STRA|nr:expressed unknown protein [Seminavis robusta]|eukprot:Sro486_g152720.1 n/a (330) ;mRNA; r:60646-61635